MRHAVINHCRARVEARGKIWGENLSKNNILARRAVLSKNNNLARRAVLRHSDHHI